MGQTESVESAESIINQEKIYLEKFFSIKKALELSTNFDEKELTEHVKMYNIINKQINDIENDIHRYNNDKVAFSKEIELYNTQYKNLMSKYSMEINKFM